MTTPENNKSHLRKICGLLNEVKALTTLIEFKSGELQGQLSSIITTGAQCQKLTELLLKDVPSAFDKAVPTTSIQLDYGDFEAMVKEAWPLQKDWEYMADVEASNNSAQHYNVDANAVFDEGTEGYNDKVTLFAAGHHVAYVSQRLLDALCRAGALPEGKYIIRVSY